MGESLLRVENLQTYLGESHIIQGISFEAHAGEVVALLGRNGAGKTTTLRSIMRMAPPRSGRVVLDGQDLTGLRTFEIARAGIAFVQETRAIFSSLSVEENLTIARRGSGWTSERVFDMFPHLAARRKNGGRDLSGGEQQMLAIARALVANPRIILLDEPSEGLAPIIVDQIEDILRALKAAGMTIVLVEQNFALATAIADRAVVIGKGRVRWSGDSVELSRADEVRHTWLGI